MPRAKIVMPRAKMHPLSTPWQILIHILVWLYRLASCFARLTLARPPPQTASLASSLRIDSPRWATPPRYLAPQLAVKTRAAGTEIVTEAETVGLPWH